MGNENSLHNFGTTEWLLTYLIAALAMGLALVPTTFIALLSGYLLGWAGLPPMVISYLLASVIGFHISRAIDSDRLMVAMSRFPKTAKAIERLRERQSGLVFFGRISPVLPFAMMNLVLPALGVRFLPFLLVGMIGMLPRTVLMIWLGDQGRDLRAAMAGGEGDFGTIAFTLLLTVLSILGLGLIVRRAFKG